MALTLGQLNRLNLKLTSFNEGIEVSTLNLKQIYFENDFDDGYEHTTTGEGIYLSRNKDLFMASSKYIDPKDIIYLFKLKWFIFVNISAYNSTSGATQGNIT